MTDRDKISNAIYVALLESRQGKPLTAEEERQYDKIANRAAELAMKEHDGSPS